jgi:hypothetical protein
MFHRDGLTATTASSSKPKPPTSSASLCTRPQHAAVFCVDENTAIQALDRLDPVLPLSPGRAERHGFEYYRHGTLSLYAALNTATDRVHGKTAARHTSPEFVAFLQEVVCLCPPRQQIHIMLDNLSSHKTQGGP